LPLTGSAAAGDSKEICVRAVEDAQVARLDGKLREAREGFVTCARAVCPTVIRQDCTRWVAEVEASLPSVVFEAVWADGGDVTGMTVLLDGKPLADTDPGRAVALDPGEHAFRFEVAGGAPVEAHKVIREGEKNRIVRVTFTPIAPAAQATPASPAGVPALGPSYPPAATNPRQSVRPVERPTPPAGRGPVPLAAYVLGGVALLGLGGFAYLGLKGTGELDTMRSTCAPHCDPSDRTSARNEILVGDILGYVGLAAAGVALWLTLTRPELTRSAATR
jgi:hypothetical protein